MSGTYDPKLRQAAAEIQEILKKHDIGAFMGLFSLTHTEFVFHIEPSWSMATFKRNPETGEVEGFRFKQRIKQQAQSDATAGMFFNMRDLAARFFQYADNAIKLLEQHMKIDHTRGEVSTEGLEAPTAAVVSFPTPDEKG